MPTNSSYEKQLEEHINKLEKELSEVKGLFHVPVPDDVVVVKEDFKHVTGRTLSFNRDLVKVMDDAGLVEKVWTDYVNVPTSKGNFGWLKTYVTFTIPKGTKLSIANYEVKRRKRKENWNQNYVKFSIIEMPNVPNADKKTFRLTIRELQGIKAELIANGEVF